MTTSTSKLKEFAIQSYSYATMPLRYAARKSAEWNRDFPVNALFYHRVSDHTPTPWTIDEDGFEKQMLWLKQNFEIIDLFEAQKRIVSGVNERPTVVITFDDGYADNSLRAIPFLIAEKIKFTYFVTTDFVVTGRAFPHDIELGTPLEPDCIESLRTLANCPHVEIGGHSRNHSDIGKITDEAELYDEVVTASRDLEKLLDTKIRYFAFPFGQIENLNNRAFEMLKEEGFLGACSAYGGINRMGQDPFHIQRIHGDPSFARIKNWLNFDPRNASKQGYVWKDDSPSN